MDWIDKLNANFKAKCTGCLSLDLLDSKCRHCIRNPYAYPNRHGKKHDEYRILAAREDPGEYQDGPEPNASDLSRQYEDSQRGGT
jgi:hypothetical protein